MPVVLPTVATPVELLLHNPRLLVLVNVDVLPEQATNVPDMDAGDVLTV